MKKKREIKKILALLLAAVMALGMGATAMADPINDTDILDEDGKIGTLDDRGKITVSGITKESGITVKAYPIIKATYSDGTNNYYTGLEAVYTEDDGIASGDVIDIPNNGGKVNITESNLNAIIGAITKKNVSANDTVDYYEMKLSEEDAKEGDSVSYTAKVPIGSYLVMIEGAEAKIYSPIVVSVQYKTTAATGTVSGNTTTVSSGDVDVTLPKAIVNGNAWVKVSGKPYVTKQIVEGNEKVDGNTANVGETVSYEISVNPIPYYGGNYPVFNVTDTLKGLSYEEGSLEVKVVDSTTGATVENLTKVDSDGNGNGDYTLKVTDNNKVLKLNFVVGDAGKEEYTLNDYAGEKLLITYKATVTDAAEMSPGANTNDVVLEYTRDSKTDGHDVSENDITYTYTFDIDGEVTANVIRKTGEGETDKNGLAGATFTLYTDKDCKNKYINDSFNGTVTSVDDGQLTITGLKAGTYYLCETEAPEGYSINAHVFKIEIEAKLSDGSNGVESGALESWKIKIDGVETASFSVDNTVAASSVTGNNVDVSSNEKDIPNTKLNELPSTGGIGTTIFTVAGIVLMVGAAAFFLAGKRKKEE